MGTNSFFFIAASAERKLLFEVVKDLDVVMFALRARPVEGVLYDRLVFVEEFTSMRAAQARQEQVRRLSARKRSAMVDFANPNWKDLAQAWFPMAASSSLDIPSLPSDEDRGDAIGGVGARVPAGPIHPPRAGFDAKAWPMEVEPSSSAWP